MEEITSIPGIGKTSRELLEVAGFLDIEALAKASVEDLVTELGRANEILRIAKRSPTRSAVQKWVDAARKLSAAAEEWVDDAPQMPVNYEGSPEVMAMLESAPCAIPLPARVMMENQVVVSDIPPAILLNRYSGDLEVRISDREPVVAVEPAPARRGSQTMQEPTPRVASAGPVPRAEPESRLDIDVSRVKTFEEFAERPKRTVIGTSHKEDDRVALLRAPLEKTNRGRDPKSPWYIRGVLHSHPIGLIFSAFITLLLMLGLPLGIISAALLFVSDQFPASLPWIPKWILVFPLALPGLGLLYFIFGVRGKCRICGQRLFWPRNCRKNSKAHHLPGLGHIVPLSLHLLIFRWFRCTYCGTPVRVKK